ncbi:MAG: phosphoribosylglycinamide formyltransferase [Robiginitomaculum sp.]|nr:phosphoribosylglycinamide formyltransferase [Robiginitomaculum sp.]
MKTRLGILISGTGSNLISIAAACEAPDFPAEIALVLSNNPKAKGLNFAKERALPTALIEHHAFDTRQAFEQAVHQELCAAKIELVCLAGFMRILSPFLVAKWPGKIINIHPSLLPAFRGLHPHQQAVEAGVRISGCTVHIVTEGLDDGPILGQVAVPVLANDTIKTLQQRVLEREHQLYPAVISHLCENQQGSLISHDNAKASNHLFSIF